MQKTILFILCLFIVILQCHAQYNGGGNDGFHRSNIANQNTLVNIYVGGTNDGFNNSIITNQNTLANIYMGGVNDGFHFASINSQNLVDNIYRGGANDGFNNSVINNQNLLTNIYKGGTNDGVSCSIRTNQNLLVNIYTGGINDGYNTKKAYGQNPLCLGNIIVWNGSVSTEWENPANWDCGVMPNINSNVEIPSGLARYPVVKISYEIKSIKLLPGSFINITNNANFILNSQ
jgi:hypothetical protein